MGLATTRADAAVVDFAEACGPVGPVAVRGGGTHWEVGGLSAPETRILRAPSGIVVFEPAEMTVRVLAGTPVAELQATLGDGGQCVNMPESSTSTVGGSLAIGWSGIRRLGWGPLRDSVLQVRYVSADGLIVKAGGPTVKNVTGFDLCRILVGSLGTIGLMAEVILRTRPLPVEERWLSGPADPFALRDALYRPASVLWNGSTTWVLLSGYPADVESEAQVAAGFGLLPAAGPPSLPPQRHSLRPGSLPELKREVSGELAHEFPNELASQVAGAFVAEVGVGTVHCHHGPSRRALRPEVGELNDRIKAVFDPTGRLNPGREPHLR